MNTMIENKPKAQPKCSSLLDKTYDMDNFFIRNVNIHGSICYVFFSSLGLYPYDDVDALSKVIDENRYEWKNISTNNKFKLVCYKQIFVRDLYKIFYQKGINSSVNSLEQLAKFINSNTDGKDVYLVGSSAGGYAALVLSNLIKNVRRIYSFGSVINLMLHSSYFDSEFFGSFDPKYVNAADHISKKASIIHFYGSKSNVDNSELLYLKQKEISNIIYVPLNSKKHAERPSGTDIVKLLTCSDAHFKRIKNCLRHKKEITLSYFSILNLGLIRFVFIKVFIFLRRIIAAR